MKNILHSRLESFYAESFPFSGCLSSLGAGCSILAFFFLRKCSRFLKGQDYKRGQEVLLTEKMDVRVFFFLSIFFRKERR